MKTNIFNLIGTRTHGYVMAYLISITYLKFKMSVPMWREHPNLLSPRLAFQFIGLAN